MTIPLPPTDAPPLDAAPRRSRRGFAAMDPALQKEIARRGGLAVHRHGLAHHFSPAQAREAGRKGGDAVSRDSAHMARIGSRGGKSSGLRRERARSGSRPLQGASPEPG